MRTNREAVYGVPAHTVWRRHIAKEDTAGANLLCNRLSGPSELSFLASSTKDMGSWASSAARRNRAALAIQRLDSGGTMPGPLQMMSSGGGSSQHLGLGADIDDLPTDFSPSPTGRRAPSQAPSLWGSDASPLFGRSASAALGGGGGGGGGEPPGWRPPSSALSSASFGSVHAGSRSSLSRPQSGSLIRSATMQSIGSWGSHWDDEHRDGSRPASASGLRAPAVPGLDERHPRPRPLISSQPGLLGHSANRQQRWGQLTIAGTR